MHECVSGLKQSVWADAQIICHHGNQGYNRFITFSPPDANEENHHGNNDQDNTKG